jgi:hypothetical protein
VYIVIQNFREKKKIHDQRNDGKYDDIKIGLYFDKYRYSDNIESETILLKKPPFLSNPQKYKPGIFLYFDLYFVE